MATVQRAFTSILNMQIRPWLSSGIYANKLILNVSRNSGNWRAYFERKQEYWQLESVNVVKLLNNTNKTNNTTTNNNNKRQHWQLYLNVTDPPPKSLDLQGSICF